MSLTLLFDVALHTGEREERRRDGILEWIEIIQINLTKNCRAVIMNADAVKVSPPADD